MIAAAASPVTPRALPAGIVTFLFTDIEGSTRLWERDTAAMWAALERHNAILGEAIRAHGGYHFKTIGDAFQAAFADPVEAVAACVDAQRTLDAETWPETGPVRVRMALHRGPAEPLPGGDYLAPSLNRLSRILSTGFGGQVLLSSAVWETVAARLPDGVTGISLGKHRLRDLLEAEEIWQLVIPGLPSTFPPLKSLEGHPTNLPQQPTALIGRDAEIAGLRELLAQESTRLVTLTGPGGVGKTRLALAAAADSLETFPDGLFLVTLAGVEDAALLMPEIAAVLGVREGGGLTLEQSVLAYLGGKQLLLVLDNLEQLDPFETAASTIAALLDAAPTVRLMSTSRAPLRIRAEQEWPVLPLSTPKPGVEVDGEAALAALAATPAVALFVERARAARPAWRLTAANAADVAEIARRLDGLPLAIELAAVRIRVLTPAEILRRLGGALDLLEARSGDRPDRQQTLRAAIAWSHDLLRFEDQVAFRRLGVFSGGFTLEAAEQVLAQTPDPWIDPLDAVSVLVEQSLIRTEEDALGETRYRMLETVRAFALEELARSGEDEAVRAAHARWVDAFARDADAHVLGPDSGEWLSRYEREHDNFRAAIAWAIEHDPLDLGLRVPESLWRFWELRGHYTEARGWLERALASGSEAPPKLRALVLDGLGNIAWRQGDLLAATQVLEESLKFWRTTGERRSIGGTLSNLGTVLELRGDLDRAQVLQEEALAIARETEEPLRVATALNNLALVIWNKGDTNRATALLEESAAIKRAQGNWVGLAITLNNLGMLAEGAGDLDGAIASMEEALALDRKLGNPDGIAHSLGNLAGLVAPTGDVARAAALDAEALAIRRDLGDRLSIAHSLDGIAATASRAGFAETGARLYGASERLREELGAPIPPSERERYETGLEMTRSAVGDEAYERSWAAGRALSLDDAVAEALDIARQIAEKGETPA
jgi:predicted ATPase/class 3 adenylate cyclase